MADKKDKKVLIGLAAITADLEMSVPTFKGLVEEGLPATIIKGKWYAHKDNLDEYFRRRTLIRPKDIDEKAE